jgi:hypothetical protein
MSSYSIQSLYTGYITNIFVNSLVKLTRNEFAKKLSIMQTSGQMITLTQQYISTVQGYLELLKLSKGFTAFLIGYQTYTNKHMMKYQNIDKIDDSCIMDLSSVVIPQQFHASMTSMQRIVVVKSLVLNTIGLLANNIMQGGLIDNLLTYDRPHDSVIENFTKLATDAVDSHVKMVRLDLFNAQSNRAPIAVTSAKVAESTLLSVNQQLIASREEANRLREKLLKCEHVIIALRDENKMLKQKLYGSPMSMQMPQQQMSIPQPQQQIQMQHFTPPSQHQQQQQPKSFAITGSLADTPPPQNYISHMENTMTNHVLIEEEKADELNTSGFGGGGSAGGGGGGSNSAVSDILDDVLPTRDVEASDLVQEANYMTSPQIQKEEASTFVKKYIAPRKKNMPPVELYG